MEVGSADEALALLRRGSRQRQRGETALNYSSSRSHSIFTVRRVLNERSSRPMRGIVHTNPSIFLGEGHETCLSSARYGWGACLQVTLYQQGLEGQDSEASGSGEESEEGVAGGEERLGRISFVDLAGSERAQRTGNVGVRLK